MTKKDKLHRIEYYKAEKLRANIVSALKKKKKKIKCRECKKLIDPDYMEIHHIFPVSSGGKTEPGNISYVCKSCHGLIRRKNKENDNLIKTEEIIKLKKIMIERNIGYEDVSKKLNISFQTVYRWCRGVYKPSRLALEKIRKFIKKNPIDIKDKIKVEDNETHG